MNTDTLILLKVEPTTVLVSTRVTETKTRWHVEDAESELTDAFIPTGKNIEDITKRRRIIKRYYSQWIKDNPQRKIWNKDLQAFIHVKGQSLNETSRHAALSPQSTKAVLRLSEIIQSAVFVEDTLPKSNRNQHIFDKVLILMTPDGIKITVGAQRATGDLIQYSIKA